MEIKNTVDLLIAELEPISNLNTNHYPHEAIVGAWKNKLDELTKQYGVNPIETLIETVSNFIEKNDTDKNRKASKLPTNEVLRVAKAMTVLDKYSEI